MSVPRRAAGPPIGWSWMVLGILGLIVLGGIGIPLDAKAGGTSATTPGFASERAFPGGGAYWEPTVAVDPTYPNYVYQAVTYINATKTCADCVGTSVFIRASSDAGSSWGLARPIYAPGGKGWQFDPQIRVATDGTVYAVFLETFDPGTVLFRSSDHGMTWQGPFEMNGNLTYNDKPILVISPSGQDVYVAFNVKLASYVAVSHDYGRHFILAKTSNESLWWYTYGGTYAPDGSVYFAQVGESGTKTTGKITNQGHVDGPDKIFVLKLNHQGSKVADTFIAQSASPTPCSVFQCYGDYFAAQAVVAANPSGNLMVAYTANPVNGTPHSLLVRTSSDGIAWNPAIVVNAQGDSNFPQIVGGSVRGDFRLAWQDNRHASCWNCGGVGDWETWFSQTTNDGQGWTEDVQLSNLGHGAPYKTPQGYIFTDGDYFGLADSPSGTNYVIWGEADGSSIYCCGGAWFTSDI